jgi:23S rRNA (guanosine2251-2'-O)-methyltransferase
MSVRIVCGINPVRQLVRLRARDVSRAWIQSDLGRERRQRLADALAALPVPATPVSAEDLDRITGGARHQGIALEYQDTGPLTEASARELVAGLERPLILALDGVQDPRNFGACLRTAEAAGVDLVVVARHRNVDLTPTVSKVAAGAAESQAIVQVGNLVRFLESVKQAGVWVVGLDEAADQSLYDLDLVRGTALVMGAEGEGLRRLTRETCDFLASLPMAGRVESLNVAVAAGVCLYECVRQRRPSLPPGGALR